MNSVNKILNTSTIRLHETRIRRSPDMSETLAADVVEHIPMLRRYALKLARNGPDADDLVQECLLRALSREHLFAPGTNLSAWLTTILRNLFFNQCKSRKRVAEVELEPDAPEVSFDAPQVHQLDLRETQQAFERLKDDQRWIILQCAVEGMSYEEAAERTGVSVGTIRSRLSRARSRLREQVAGRIRPAYLYFRSSSAQTDNTRAGNTQTGNTQTGDTGHKASGGTELAVELAAPASGELAERVIADSSSDAMPEAAARLLPPAACSSIQYSEDHGEDHGTRNDRNGHHIVGCGAPGCPVGGALGCRAVLASLEEAPAPVGLSGRGGRIVRRTGRCQPGDRNQYGERGSRLARHRPWGDHGNQDPGHSLDGGCGLRGDPQGRPSRPPGARPAPASVSSELQVEVLTSAFQEVLGSKSGYDGNGG
jgi:RNA polymerase sigma-70 factor, ECF subfamily